MKAEHRAIVARAKKEDLQPSELASELMLHDMVQACINELSQHEVGFRKMSEKQQDSAISQLQGALKDSALLAARIIAGANTATVEMTLKDLKVSNGTITGIVKSTEDHFNELISKVQDKSDVLIVLYERDYFDGLDAIQGEKDQKSLPLDAEQAADKKPAKPRGKAAGATKSAADIANEVAPVNLDPELLAKAREFITTRRVPTIAGVQNILSIGFKKAEAVLAQMVSEGIVIAEEVDGKTEYKMPPLAEAAPKGKGKGKPAADQAEQPKPDTLTDETYEKIKARVIEKQEVVPSALAVLFDVSISIADAAVDRLEMDGVISEEDEMGGRVVFDQPDA